MNKSEKKIIQEARNWISDDLSYFESMGDDYLYLRAIELLKKLDRILADRKAINDE